MDSIVLWPLSYFTNMLYTADFTFGTTSDVVRLTDFTLS